MSFARIFSESVQKTCTTVTWVPYTVIFLHGDNSFAASYSAPLSFRVELGIDLVSRGAFSTLVNNLIRNLDPVLSTE